VGGVFANDQSRLSHSTFSSLGIYGLEVIFPEGHEHFPSRSPGQINDGLLKNAYDAWSVDLFTAAELEDVSESELQADPDGDGPDHLIVFIAVKDPRLLKR
jgi:hypothetical protein